MWSRRWESNPVHALIWSFAVYKAARAPYTSPGHSGLGLAYEWHELWLVYQDRQPNNPASKLNSAVHRCTIVRTGG